MCFGTLVESTTADFFCTAAVKGLLTICFDRILAGNRELDEYNRKSNWLGSSVTVWVLGRELGNS